MQSERRHSQLVVSLLPAAALVVLAASGLVLVSSSFIDYPTPILVVAAGVALVAGITVAVSGWREARRTGVGYLGSLAASMKRLGRFARDFL
ncbi:MULTISPECIES: hypothetical protein [unclassified Knoellia]|uniref:hypothetical protein n=1 Tax=Knoellia altitudinis TaxID=3404795 RepID=UPI0036119FDF